MDVQLKKGLIEECVLAVLKKEDSYGYKIIQDISTCITISESTLYPILRRLESDGCLEIYTVEHNGRLRKYYKITNKGKKQLDEFIVQWKSVMKVYDFIREGVKYEN